MDNSERIREIDRKIFLVGILDSPGAIMVGLGVYAKFATDGDAFLPILNNPTVVNVMIGFGGAIMLWGAATVVKLSLERRRLAGDQ